MDSTHILEQIDRWLLAKGFGDSTDRYRVCRVAMGHMGKPYLRTEELTNSSIDCSTLTSQPHWEGALYTIPFIAEGQRTGRTGRQVTDLSTAIPGDVFIRYPSVDKSPDGQYNHVALYLGEDDSSKKWVIESRGDKGVILTAANDFPPEGGIRRYLSDANAAYNSPEAKAAMLLAIHVPKLGRPGARQYLETQEDRIPHTGVDIYVSKGTAVYAPVSGLASPYRSELEQASGITITSDNLPYLAVTLLHLNTKIKSATRVNVGDIVGHIASPHMNTVRYVSGLTPDCAHLHFDLYSNSHSLLDHPAHLQDNCRFYFNPLLAMKQGFCASPISNQAFQGGQSV